jgi:hypothetical protein
VSDSSALPVVVCIDVEPDAPLPDRNARVPWDGFDQTIDLLEAMRSRLTDAGRTAHYSWFVRADPQIGEIYGSAGWAFEHYRAHVDDVRSRGDEIGLHVHPYRWDSGTGGWLEDFADAEWVHHCVRTAFRTYRAALGSDCAVFRMGSRWLDDDTVALLDELGVTVDLSVEPGEPSIPVDRQLVPATAPLPDYRSAPESAFRPSTADYLRPASDGSARALWMLPLTNCRTRRLRRRTLRVWSNPRVTRRALDAAIARRPYLAVAIRASMLADASRQPIIASLEHLERHRRPLTFVTAPEALARIQSTADRGAAR